MGRPSALDIDTSTPAGEMAANIIISGPLYERRLISQRTRDALAAKRARGERLGGSAGFTHLRTDHQPAVRRPVGQAMARRVWARVGVPTP